MRASAFLTMLYLLRPRPFSHKCYTYYAGRLRFLIIPSYFTLQACSASCACSASSACSSYLRCRTRFSISISTSNRTLHVHVHAHAHVSHVSTNTKTSGTISILTLITMRRWTRSSARSRTDTLPTYHPSQVDAVISQVEERYELNLKSLRIVQMVP